MSEWQIDIASARAVHTSGVEIIFSGNPESSNFDGKPTGFPNDMSAFEQVSLIRTGFEAYRKAYQAGHMPRVTTPSKTQIRHKPVINKKKSNRPVMSLTR